MEIEKGGIRTGHTDFIGFGPAIAKKMQSMQERSNDKSNLDVILVKADGSEINLNTSSVSFVSLDDAKEFLVKLADRNIIKKTKVMDLAFDKAATAYLSSLHPEHDR